MNDRTFMEHLQKICKENICKKNGLICYTYNDGQNEEGYYNPDCMNIGDYIQSLAAKQFLPSIDEFVDRDQLGEYNGDNINMIMNAWYYIWKKNRIFSKKIRPLLVAIHINNPEEITFDTLKYFKENEPIGCRDYQTRDFLKRNNIKAYFSGCMTLTLGETYKISDNERTNDIYFVNYKLGKKENRLIDTNIQNILKEFPKCKIHYKTHIYPLSKNYLGALYEAENLIKEYAKAKLVITENIHCALPCLSLGTPVILIIPEFDKKRFYGLINLLNYIGKDDKGNFKSRINRDNNGNIVNTNDYQIYANRLKNICMEFMQIDDLNKNKCKKVNFEYHQKDNFKYKIEKNFKLIKKQKIGNIRKITLFGFIKITYKKRVK